MSNVYIIIISIILGIAALIIIIWVAYSITAAYQQTLAVQVPFEQTYRYIPNLSRERKFKLDKIKITVTGPVKRDASKHATIIPAEQIKALIYEQIVSPHKGCLLVHEVNTFIVEENVLKRFPITKAPTLENLSIMFFNKLAPLMPDYGCQLISVKLFSEGITVTHSRYKMNNYYM